ncbi:MAG: leucine--tRNA ligase [archaeon]
MEKYKPEEIERKWREKWKEEKLSRAEVKNLDKKEPKYMLHFAYPNVTGFMHIGHMRGYSYTDFIARKKRMEGHNVFFPGGIHASGNNLLSIIKKVKSGEKLQYMKDHGATEEEIEKVKESPEKALEVFSEAYRETWKKYGLSFDEESWTSTTYPEYSKFIEWQFIKLKEKGLLKQGKYYASSCPEHGPVAIDESETDISKGGKAEEQEYVVLKFKSEDEDFYLTAATLRPETVFGQTNLFLDPEVTYLEVEVNEENWVVSKPAAEKLELQGKEIKEKREIKGKELLGKKVKAPGLDKWIPILPSKFCSPEEGTGIVTSVPSDAPYDWMGIKELKENPEALEKYGVDPSIMDEVKPIPIIDSKGYGELPAKEICEEKGIKNTEDPKLEEATKEIYKKGFHSGRMNKNCGEYSEMKVEQAKEKVKEEMIRKNQADILRDLSEEVICRCGKKVNIREITDQWFINYGNRELTEKTKKHAKEMDIKPEKYHENIQETLDWFEQRAATRQGNWLGTKLPWDKKWIIEPIADSTLYPAYYIISKFVNKGEIKEENLTPEFFNYVFLEEITLKEAADSTGLKEEKLKEIRKAFDYWYPDDLNEGGKEHKTVHFPPFLMNHVAIFPEKYWPKSILVNWWLTGKGGKLSKSKGGARISADKMAEKYGVDTMRLFYAHESSPFNDITFTQEKGESYKRNLEKFWEKTQKMINAEEVKEEEIDKWLKSRFNTHLEKAEEAFEEKDFRKVIDEILFDFMKDVDRYRKRKETGKTSKTVKETIKRWIKSMAPYTPFICEEIWEKTVGNGLISREKYPEIQKEEISEETELAEETIKNLEEDIRNVMNLVEVEKPSKIKLFIATEWKRKAYEKAVKTKGNVIKEIMKDEEIKKHGKKAASYGQYLQKNKYKLRKKVISKEKEVKAVEQSIRYLKETFEGEIKVIDSEKTEEKKAEKSMPMKPAILVE